MHSCPLSGSRQVSAHYDKGVLNINLAKRLFCDKYISSLLENTRFLPIGITAKRRRAQ